MKRVDGSSKVERPRFGAPSTIRMPDRRALESGALVAGLASLAAVLALWPVGAGNDQGLFVYYARLIREGAILYRDIWDNKQPGIFGFYAGAAGLFGEGWPAARLAYALWLGAGAGVLAIVCRLVAPASRVWLLAPVLTVGLALVRTDAERPAQVEALMGLPLAALLLLCLIEPATPAARRLRWISAGVVTGIVASLKLVLAPVAAVLIAAGLLWRIMRRESTVAGAAGAIVLSLCGFAMVWGPILAYFQMHEAMPAFAWTMLDYPRLALQQVEVQKPAMLVGAFRWLLVTTALLLPAAALFAWRVRRPWTQPGGLVLAACLGWVFSGLAMIAMQRFSWWDTHMDLVVWPIGLLAALGVARTAADRADRWTERMRLGAIGCIVLAVLFHGGRFARGVLADPDWPKPREELLSLEVARRVVATADLPCRTVYAIGDQAGVERATGLRQAIATHGLWFGAFLPAQAARLPDELAQARPDLVYFDGNERRDFMRKFPAAAAAIDRWLERDYERREADPLNGQWWQRKVAPPDAGNCPKPQPFTPPARAVGA